ncbi:MAG: hypothetical protein U0802_00780 [Candidatus Binatia bacterium]
MSSDPRITRPVLQRSQPVRNWATLFETPGGDTGTADAPDSAAPAGPSLNDVVTRSVDPGYRVIDEYMRQGQKAAQRLNERSYGAQTMAGDVQDLAMRLTQYASTSPPSGSSWCSWRRPAAALTGALSPGPGAVRRGESPPSPAVDAGGARPAAAAPVARVRIEACATQPTEVAVDALDPTPSRCR